MFRWKLLWLSLSKSMQFLLTWRCKHTKLFEILKKFNKAWLDDFVNFSKLKRQLSWSIGGPWSLFCVQGCQTVNPLSCALPSIVSHPDILETDKMIITAYEPQPHELRLISLGNLSVNKFSVRNHQFRCFVMPDISEAGPDGDGYPRKDSRLLPLNAIIQLLDFWVHYPTFTKMDEFLKISDPKNYVANFCGNKVGGGVQLLSKKFVAKRAT